MVTLVDDCTIKISSFNYDGLGPDVWVLGGSSNAPAALKTNRRLEPIPKRSSGYSGADFNVVLGANVTFDLLAGSDAPLVITVYCVQFAAEFGSATLRQGMAAPTTAPRALCNDWVGASGTITTLAHKFGGKVTIKADCSLQIDNAVYDGRGPGAYFLFGPNNRDLDASSFRIPERATRAFDNECFPLSLPIDQAWDTLANGTGAVKFGLYCVPFKQLFGEVVLTKPASPPASAGPRARCVAANGCPTRVPQCLSNCAMLSDNVNVWWQTNGADVTIELEAEVDAGSWVAFGVSETGAMLGADVTVAGWMNDKPQALDYYLTEYSQCNYAAGATSGVCPDNNLRLVQGRCQTTQNDKKGRSDVTLVSGERVASVQRVRYRRKLDTGDVCDRAITAASKFVFGTGSITPDPQRTRRQQARDHAQVDQARPALDARHRRRLSRRAAAPAGARAQVRRQEARHWRQGVLHVGRKLRDLSESAELGRVVALDGERHRHARDARNRRRARHQVHVHDRRRRDAPVLHCRQRNWRPRQHRREGVGGQTRPRGAPRTSPTCSSGHPTTRRRRRSTISAGRTRSSAGASTSSTRASRSRCRKTPPPCASMANRRRSRRPLRQCLTTPFAPQACRSHS
jgi:hypothetical protein